MLVGVNGDLGGGWTLDAYLADGRERRLETQFGNISHAAVRTLLEAADGGPSICSGGYNPFGTNPISAACATYISRVTKNSTTFNQKLAEANVQGPLFNLPAGEVRVAAGATTSATSTSSSPTPSCRRATPPRRRSRRMRRA